MFKITNKNTTTISDNHGLVPLLLTKITLINVIKRIPSNFFLSRYLGNVSSNNESLREETSYYFKMIASTIFCLSSENFENLFWFKFYLFTHSSLCSHYIPRVYFRPFLLPDSGGKNSIFNWVLKLDLVQHLANLVKQ